MSATAAAPANFSQYIEDFSKTQKFINNFTKIFGMSPEEASKLTFDEKMDLMFDETIECIMAKKAVDEARDKCFEKLNLIGESQKDITARVMTLPLKEQLAFAANTQEFMSSDAFRNQQEANATRNYLISKGFTNSYYNCKICGKTHRLDGSHLTEHALAIHQELAFKHLGEFFLDKANIPKSAKTILNRMHDEMLAKIAELNKLFLTSRIRFEMLMRTLYNCYLESVKFLVEFSLTLMNILKRNATKDTHKTLLIGKTIYELTHFIRKEGIDLSPTSYLRMLRTYQNTQLFNLFEAIQADISEELYMFYCCRDGRVTSSVIYEFEDKVIDCTKRVKEFNDTLIAASMVAIEGDIKKLYTEKFITLFKLMESEFTDDFKTQFLKLFTQEAYEKYKSENKLSDEEMLSFEKGKQFDHILDLFMDENYDLIQSIISEVPIDHTKETSEFSSDVFLRTGYKLWFDYDYSEQDDPFLYKYIPRVVELKKKLLGRLTNEFEEADYVLLPRTYNDKLTLYRSFKSNQEWLDNYVPTDPESTYRAFYIYMLNNPMLCKKLTFKSKTPDFKMLSQSELSTIKRIFKITSDELDKLAFTLNAI